ncbi:MAG: hypothetical protein GF364_22680 [Candidatus Lokiarchaeota archaeon]|nr:hypothetical protein [Candidatus Lokiarchaeota archaeon]
MSRRYYGIKNVNLTTTQRADLLDALKAWGDNAAPNACNRNHWRLRLDNDAIVFEANWDTSEWTLDSVKAKLGQIFGVNPDNIGHTTNAGYAYGYLVTFSYGGTNYVRMIAFGGVSSTYADSHAAVLQFLSDNAAAWEPETL